MATHKLQTSTSIVNTTSNVSLIKRFNDFADGQQPYAIVWWIVSLTVLGGLFLPLTFLLVYSLGGPAAPFLALSMISFFASLVANMGGMGIRVALSTFFFSIALHLAMIVITVAAY
jgi:hypothetical protein